MRRPFVFLAVLVTLTACVNGADQVAGPGIVARMPNATVSPQDLSDRYIVVFRDEVSDPAGLADLLVNAAGGTVHYRYAHALKGFAATLPPQAIPGLQRNPVVKYIVADGPVSITAAGSDNTVSSWGLNRIDQRNLPLDNLYEWTTDGTGVTAYILDTGIRTTHNDFGGRASIGFDAYGGTGIDCNGHGTHVSGTVGGNEYGVARNVSLVAVRVLDCGGSGSWGGVISGVDWVRQNAKKPAVANMSLGGGLNTALNDALTNAINAGVTFAVAAGNSNGANACFYSPASTPAALTVGATDINDNRASYSNIGSCLDLFAPGTSITSDWYTSNTATANLSGTSMATPHVAGVVALYLSANPSASPAQVETAIEAAATPGKVTNAGTGSPNLLLYSRMASSGNSAPTAAFTNSCANLVCTFSAATSNDTDGTIVSFEWNFGDGSSGTGVSPGHTYAAAGTYTVTLTVTDDDAASGQTSTPVTVTAAGGGGITLSATGYKVKGLQKVDLTWSGASTAIDIFRNNAKIVTATQNDGFQTDAINARGGASYSYRVCQTGTTTCSNTVTVIF